MCAEPVCGVNEINGLYAAALAVLVEVQRLHNAPAKFKSRLIRHLWIKRSRQAA